MWWTELCSPQVGDSLATWSPACVSPGACYGRGWATPLLAGAGASWPLSRGPRLAPSPRSGAHGWAFCPIRTSVPSPTSPAPGTPAHLSWTLCLALLWVGTVGALLTPPLGAEGPAHVRFPGVPPGAGGLPWCHHRLRGSEPLLRIPHAGLGSPCSLHTRPSGPQCPARPPAPPVWWRGRVIRL